MKTLSILTLVAAGALALGSAQQASAATIIADTVLDFFDSGAGPMPGPYGGTFPGSFPVPVSLSYATDGIASTFVSLPSGSYLTLGFSTGYVFNGPGLDIFVSEVGGADETAAVFISSDFGTTFTYLGMATTATVSGFDLASIGYTGIVNAVKIFGFDSFGGSPGFDLAYVEGLEGSVVSTVPDSGTTAWLLGSILMLFAATRSRRGRRSA
jgi:hypothetical protein